MWRRYVHEGPMIGGLLLVALFFFELFNFSTTEFALHDLLGNLAFAGIQWSTILAIAFCGIDFAGIARLFAGHSDQGHFEVWYLFGAWFLASIMNAMLTWWGVSVALLEHMPRGVSIIGQETAMTVIPVFIALLVWLVRVLLMGTLILSGPRLFSAIPTLHGTAPGVSRSRVVHRTSVVHARARERGAGEDTGPVNLPRGRYTQAPPVEPRYEPLSAAPRHRNVV